jgi:hypothetical protein
LGGVAYVMPPQRPGAVLWSIAAGPLVNVALFPILLTVWLCSRSLGWAQSTPDLYLLISTLLTIDVVLFVFNMMPFYPLDGGQILRAFLWFVFGRANSLMIASTVGFIGIGVVGLLAALEYSSGDSQSAIWIGIICVFMATNCWRGFQQSRALYKLEKTPRHPEFSCPVCHTSPPVGNFWGCIHCRKPFDIFQTQGVCPHCQAQYPAMACPFCYSLRPLAEWRGLQPNPPSVSQ